MELILFLGPDSGHGEKKDWAYFLENLISVNTWWFSLAGSETLFLFGAVNNLCPSTANFALPEEDKDAAVPTFVEITFVELNREEAMKIVEQYNKVAEQSLITLL